MSNRDERFALKHALGKIESQDSFRRLSDGRLGCNPLSLNLEVFSPGIISRIEKPDKLARSFIERSDVGAFSAIAEGTSERQVLKNRLAVVLFTDNVIDLTTEIGSRSWMRQYSQAPPARS